MNHEPLNARWRLAILAVCAMAGCRSPAPTLPPAAEMKRGAEPTPIAGDLSVRPLYTFNHSELDQHLGAVAASEPDLLKRVMHFGRKNISQPYEIYLLGEFPFEGYDPDPIYDLTKSDCVVFCEHVYSMALSQNFPEFLRTLQRIRYRNGEIGMLTRNHYTIADWDRNNAFLFEDMTRKLGGGSAWTPLMQVCKRSRFFAKFGIGQDIPDEPIEDAYIPKENVPAVLDELRSGDFVNIIRGNADSQYAGHTGMIAIGEDGTVNFLHSARPAVREEPLLGYLDRDTRCLGIKILRLRPDAERIMRETLANSPSATDVSDAALSRALEKWPPACASPPSRLSKDWVCAMRLQSYRLDFDTPTDPQLQAALEQIDRRVAHALDLAPQERAFGVLDLTDRRLALIRPDEMFYGASVPKICILLAYFETHPEAVEDLDPQTQRELQLMIKRSDNELAAKYSQIVGLERIQELLQSDRYHFYNRDHGGGFWCGKHYGIDQPRTGDPVHDHSHAATVRQCLRYYLMLEQGRLISPQACARMKRIFAAPRLDFFNANFVRGLNGRDVSILRKSGLWEDWHLDTARVQHGDRVYLLAGMTHHPEGQEYLAQMAAAVDDLLCGPQREPLPYAHRLFLHEASDIRLFDVSGSGDSVTYTSPVIEPDIKFNEVVPSWNVDAPPDSGFFVEIRVGRRFFDSWSPWLYVGEGGDLAAPDPGHSGPSEARGPASPGDARGVQRGDRVVEFDDGRIDIDYLRSDERFDRVQYRVHAISAPDGSAPRIARFALCVSDTTGMPDSVPPPRQDGSAPPPQQWQRRLAVPFRSQKAERPELAGRICSPTSVSMLLEYYGINHPTAEVAAACYDPVHDIYGNWPRNVQAAYRMGLPGYLTRFSDWHAVERMIAAGQPLIISIRVEQEGGLRGAPYRETDGHLIVLTGFEGTEYVTVNDPAARDPQSGQRRYLREDLERAWMRGSGGLTYVLEPPAPRVQ